MLFGTHFSEVVPMVFYLTQRIGRMVVKVAEESAEITDYFDTVWTQTVPEIPLQMEWLSDSVTELYDQQTRTLRLLAGVSIIAIGVACLGLYAVASLVTGLRRREVAMRKVFGATIVDVADEQTAQAQTPDDDGSNKDELTVGVRWDFGT